MRDSEGIAPFETPGVSNGTATVGLFALDREWRVRYVSESLQPLFARPVADYLARHLLAALPEFCATPLERALRASMSDRAERSITTVWPGTTRRCDVHIHPAARRLSIIVVAADELHDDWGGRSN